MLHLTVKVMTVPFGTVSVLSKLKTEDAAVVVPEVNASLVIVFNTLPPVLSAVVPLYTWQALSSAGALSLPTSESFKALRRMSSPDWEASSWMLPKVTA